MERQTQDRKVVNLERGLDIKDGETLEENKAKPLPPQRVLSLEEPPDGGWGWVMVMGSGMTLSIILVSIRLYPSYIRRCWYGMDSQQRPQPVQSPYVAQ